VDNNGLIHLFDLTGTVELQLSQALYQKTPLIILSRTNTSIKTDGVCALCKRDFPEKHTNVAEFYGNFLKSHLPRLVRIS